MIEFAEKKGMGAIGLFFIMGITAFFWTMFFIYLNLVYNQVLPNICTDTDTLAYFNANIKLIWFPVIPLLFLFSMCLWALIQMQNPLATPAIAVVWITIVVAWWTYSASFLMFDPFIMKTFPTLLPQEEIFIDTYASFIPPLWRGLTWLIAFTLAIFGCYLAPSYIERGGRTYDFSTGY